MNIPKKQNRQEGRERIDNVQSSSMVSELSIYTDIPFLANHSYIPRNLLLPAGSFLTAYLLLTAGKLDIVIPHFNKG